MSQTHPVPTLGLRFSCSDCGSLETLARLSHVTLYVLRFSMQSG